MSMNNRLVLLLNFQIVFIILLAGCYNSGDPLPNTLRIAYIAKLHQESFHDGIANGVKKASSKMNVGVDIFPAESQQDVATQKNKLREIAANNSYNGVILAPNDSLALIEDVVALDKAGIPFILVDTPLLDTSDTLAFANSCGFVGTNNIKAGELAARFIASTLSGGRVLLMRGNHAHRSSIDREKGFLEEMQNNPQFILLTPIVGFWETEASLKSFGQFMSHHPNAHIDAVFAYSDPMAIGISRYFDIKRIAHRPIIIGVDGVLLGQKAVLEGRTDATVVQAPEVMGEIALQNLTDCIVKKSYRSSEVLTPVSLLKASRSLEVVTNP